MRPIHLVQLDKTRPAVLLTRERFRSVSSRVTVAPITSVIRGLSTEVPVGPSNGLDSSSVVSCDNIVTVRNDMIGRHIGYLLAEQETALTEAILLAFDLE